MPVSLWSECNVLNLILFDPPDGNQPREEVLCSRIELRPYGNSRTCSFSPAGWTSEKQELLKPRSNVNNLKTQVARG